MTPSRFCIHYVSKSVRLSSGHRTGRGQSSSQFPRRVVPNSVLTRQLHSSPMLLRSCLKFCTWLQHYVNQELPDVELGSRRGREIRDQIANTHWIIKKARKFQEGKKIYCYFIDSGKAFDCVDHDKLWKALWEIGIPDHLTCLLRNLHVGQEAAVKTLYGTTDWFKIEKGVQ